MGWKITSHFHQHYQNTLTDSRQKSSGWWDTACWRSSLFQVHHQYLHLQPNSPTEIHLRAFCLLYIREASELQLPVRHQKFWGGNSFPSFWLPPRTHFQQHTTHPHGSPASTQGGAWLSPHSSVSLCTINELKRQSQMLVQLAALPKSWAQEFS